MNRKLMTPFVATLALVVSLGAPTAQASSNGPSVRLDGSNGSFFPYSPNCGTDWCYGTTWFGGSLNMGTVYRVKPDGTGYSVVGNF